jgi:hypothetical protein
MAQAAKAALRSDNLDVVADRGYFKGEEILACELLHRDANLVGLEASDRQGNAVAVLAGKSEVKNRAAFAKPPAFGARWDSSSLQGKG